MKIVNVPMINGLGKTKGCEMFGDEVLKYLDKLHSKESGEIISVKNLSFEKVGIDNSNIEDANKLAYGASFEVLEKESKVLFLGGDHSVSYPLSRAFFDSCQNSGKEPCIIVFDSHPDCMPPMKEPTHEEWLRKLIDDGFPKENVLIVGLRNSWKDEWNYLKEKGIRLVSMNQLLLDLEDSCDIIMEFANGKELYVSIDIDVVDPAYAPATGYPEPGGLTGREMIYLVQRINKMKNLRAVDIVEINPEKDDSGLTVKLGAKILAEFL
jgi:agmatinase